MARQRTYERAYGHQGSALAARRAERADMVRGAALGIGLPVIVIVVMNMFDFGGKFEERVSKAGVWADDVTSKAPPPMTVAHAQEVLAQIRRLYTENYQRLFVPRLERQDLTSAQRFREWECANAVWIRATSLLRETLLSELAKPDTELKPIEGPIREWERAFADAEARHRRLNPWPESMRR